MSICEAVKSLAAECDSFQSLFLAASRIDLAKIGCEPIGNFQRSLSAKVSATVALQLHAALCASFTFNCLSDHDHCKR